MKKLLLEMCVALMAVAARAATMVWDFAYVDYYYPDDPCIRTEVANGVIGGGCTLGITIEILSGGAGSVARVVADKGPMLAFDMSWREMGVGDEVSRATMTGEDKEYFFSNWNEDLTFSPSTSDYDLLLGCGETKYLGVLDTDFYSGDHYCWLELIFDGTTVYVGQSAMDLDGGPVVIQPRGVPEPGAAVLALLGVCACALRRKVA